MYAVPMISENEKPARDKTASTWFSVIKSPIPYNFFIRVTKVNTMANPEKNRSNNKVWREQSGCANPAQ